MKFRAKNSDFDGNLNGNVPSALDSLTELRVFNVENSMLSGTLPKFGSSPNIEELYFARNDFHGSVPSEYGSRMPNLRTLLLDGNDHLSGPLPSFSPETLSNLKTLRIEKTEISGVIPDDICQLTEDTEDPLYISATCTKVECDCCECFGSSGGIV